MIKKHIVIGVTGGIAAYKTLDVISQLKKKNFDISVIMTKNACEFVTPLSFQTLAQNYTITDTFESPKEWDVKHVSLAKRADLFLIAPATANIIGKVAHGIADDMLSTTIMATKAPVIFAPAMNTNMYENPIVQENIASLKSKGYYFIEPDSGRLACGDIGKGKMASPDHIVMYITNYFNSEKDLEGLNILITAGPTIESIDPMRYITNHSSGKMGYALAEAAQKRGANVKLISGPTHLPKPEGVDYIGITTAMEMYERVNEHFHWSDVVIKAAAVADYRPASVSKNKLKKSDGSLTLELVRNPDILAELGKKKGDKILVGFAAETENLQEYAKKKLISKNLDLIVANNLVEEGAGFKNDTNIVTIIKKSGEVIYPGKMKKADLANIILNQILNLKNSI